MTTNLDKKMVSEDGYDLCVSCGAKTKYKTETHIDAREDYIIGAGQLCPPCGQAVNNPKMVGTEY